MKVSSELGLDYNIPKLLIKKGIRRFYLQNQSSKRLAQLQAWLQSSILCSISSDSLNPTFNSWTIQIGKPLHLSHATHILFDNIPRSSTVLAMIVTPFLKGLQQPTLLDDTPFPIYRARLRASSVVEGNTQLPARWPGHSEWNNPTPLHWHVAVITNIDPHQMALCVSLHLGTHTSKPSSLQKFNPQRMRIEKYSFTVVEVSLCARNVILCVHLCIILKFYIFT